MKNEFRHGLEVLAQVEIEPGGKCHAVAPRLALLIKAAFLEERCITETYLSKSLFPDQPQQSIHITFHRAYTKLVDDGRILTSFTGTSGHGQSPFAFDLGRAEPFSAQSFTLRNLTEKFQESSASDSAKCAVLAAVRVAVGEKRHASAAVTLRAAESTPCTQFHGLVRRFEAQALLDKELSKKTIQNFCAALRRLLSFGLREDRFPLYFPPNRADDAWTNLIEDTCPIASGGPTSAAVLRVRVGMFMLFDVLKSEKDIVSPGDFSAAQVKIAVRKLSAPARSRDRAKVRAMQKTRGCAGVNWSHPVLRVVLQGIELASYHSAIPYLQIANGAKGSVSTFEGFNIALRSHGLSDQWCIFFEWYREYSSLGWRQIEFRREEFPSRPRVRKLAENTFLNRVSAARAYLGLALERFPDSFRELSPEVVFGRLFVPLTDDLLKLWTDAAKNNDGVSHEASAGLASKIIGGGLIARALYDRAIHLRGERPDTTSSTDLNIRDFVDRERQNPDRSSVELALLHAYEYSRSVAGNLEADRRSSSGGSGKNSVKDLRRCIRETPFIHFQRAQEHLLDRVRQSIDLGESFTRDALQVTVVTLVHGILVASGCRRSELAHLREGTHVFLEEGRRDVTLRAIDRKNRSAHDFVLRERWLPTWFLKHYRETVYPFLQARSGLPAYDRPFLILNPYRGRPVGAMEEDAAGAGRRMVSLGTRMGEISNLWRFHVATAFNELGFTVPEGRQCFSMHVVRNVAGHAVFRKFGLEAAAHFLGDRVASVEGVYAALKGEYVDTSLLDL
jgi:hypothetical protein